MKVEVTFLSCHKAPLQTQMYPVMFLFFRFTIVLLEYLCPSPYVA